MIYIWATDTGWNHFDKNDDVIWDNRIIITRGTHPGYYYY